MQLHLALFIIRYISHENVVKYLSYIRICIQNVFHSTKVVNCKYEYNGLLDGDIESLILN